MPAMFNASIQPAVFAGQDRARCMPSFMHCASMTTAASIVILETGVLAPVSLVVRMLSLILLLVLPGLLLALSGLTRLNSLVGLITGLHLSTAQGD